MLELLWFCVQLWTLWVARLIGKSNMVALYLLRVLTALELLKSPLPSQCSSSLGAPLRPLLCSAGFTLQLLLCFVCFPLVLGVLCESGD